MEFTNKRNKYNNMFIVVVTIVLLCSCMWIGTAIAWLTRVYTFTDNHNQTGGIHLGLYANGTKVTGTFEKVGGVTTWTCDEPYAISGSTVDRNNINLKIRNEGTIDALVRATISLYYLENPGDPENSNRVNLIISDTPSQTGQVKLTYNNWVTQFPSPTVACGYMFYNSKLEPYTHRELQANGTIINTDISANEIPIFNSLKLSDSQRNTVVYLSVTIEAVAYDGNIYRKIERGETTSADIPVSAYPFGFKSNLPSSWTAWE